MPPLWEQRNDEVEAITELWSERFDTYEDEQKKENFLALVQQLARKMSLREMKEWEHYCRLVMGKKD